MEKEDMEIRRREITAFYESNIPHLKVQKEYEELLCAIEETRARRIQAVMFMAEVEDRSKKTEDEGKQD
jgi:hypothetical protein